MKAILYLIFIFLLPFLPPRLIPGIWALLVLYCMLKHYKAVFSKLFLLSSAMLGVLVVLVSGNIMLISYPHTLLTIGYLFYADVDRKEKNAFISMLFGKRVAKMYVLYERAIVMFKNRIKDTIIGHKARGKLKPVVLLISMLHHAFLKAKEMSLALYARDIEI